MPGIMAATRDRIETTRIFENFNETLSSYTGNRTEADPKQREEYFSSAIELSELNSKVIRLHLFVFESTESCIFGNTNNGISHWI